MKTSAFVSARYVLTQAMNAIDLGMSTFIYVNIASLTGIAGVGTVAIEAVNPINAYPIRTRAFRTIININFARFSYFRV